MTRTPLFHRLSGLVTERHGAFLLLGTAALLWSGNFILGRVAAGDLPPITLGFWRWILACGLLLLIGGGRHLVREWPLIRPVWCRLSLLAVMAVSLFNVLVYAGLQTTSATNGLLINSTTPILIVLLAALFNRQPLIWRQVLGVVLSTTGVVLLVLRGDLSSLSQLTFAQGDLFIITAAIIWSLYSIGLKWKPATLSPLTFLTFLTWVGTCPLLVIYLINPFDEPPLVLSFSNTAIILYTGIFSSLVAFFCWNQGIRTVGAATGGQFVHLMPLFGIIMAFFFLGEVPHLFHILGGGLIFCGLVLALRQK